MIITVSHIKIKLRYREISLRSPINVPIYHLLILKLFYVNKLQ